MRREGIEPLPVLPERETIIGKTTEAAIGAILIAAEHFAWGNHNPVREKITSLRNRASDFVGSFSMGLGNEAIHIDIAPKDQNE